MISNTPCLDGAATFQRLFDAVNYGKNVMLMGYFV